MEKQLLLCVDYQNDFVCGALGFAAAAALEDGIAAEVESCLARGGYVLFTRDSHGENYLATREGAFLPLPHCIAGSSGRLLYGKLHQYETAATARTAFIDKESFGAAGIAQAVQALCGGVPQRIDICGVVTDICVITNALLLHTAFPLAKICILGALVGSGNAENAAKALDVLAGMGIATV